MLAELLREAPRFYSPYNLLLFGQALLQTLGLSVGGGAIGLVAGAALAVLRMPRLVGLLPARWFAFAYVELFRRIPFLVKLLCVFFGFQIAGLHVSLFTVALTAISLSAAAFAAELVRTGLQSVPASQVDAAEAMNFSRTQILFGVMLPQAWPVMIPPCIGYLIGFIKSTSIASQLGVLELTYAAKIMNTKGFSAVLCFGTILVLYFLLCYPLSLLGGWAERRVGRSGRAPPEGLLTASEVAIS